MRFLDRVLIKVALALFIVIMFTSIVDVSAYDSSKEFNKQDVSTWRQLQDAFIEDGQSQNITVTLGTSGKTIARAGCGYYSLSYMLVKLGYLNPKTETPIDVVKKANSGNNTDSGGWHFDFTHVNIFNADLECAESYVDVSWMSLKEQKAYVKKKYDEGLFVIICIQSDRTAGHYIFLDGFEGDDMVIGDSAFDGIKWSEHYAKNNGSMKYVHLIRSKSGKKPADLPSIYSGITLSDSTLSENEEITYSRLIDEWELNGMPKKYPLSKVQCEISLDGELTSLELKNLNTIKNSMRVEKKEKWIGIVNILVSAVGILLLLYGVLLVGAYIFDRVNMFFDFSLVNILLFGNYVIYDGEELGVTGPDNEKKFLSKRGLAKRVLIVVLVGMLLINKSILLDFILKIYSMVFAK